MPLWLKEDYRLLYSCHPPDNRYFVSFLRRVHAEATHIIRVDCEARIVLYISHRHRVAIVSQTAPPPCPRGGIGVQSDRLHYYTYPFMVYYIYAIESENCFCAGIILFICECLRYRLPVGPM
jgi:hypothetical protein